MISTKSIETQVLSFLKSNYDVDFPSEKLIINQTLKQFEGEYTVVIFPFVKMLKKDLAEIGKELGDYLKDSDCKVKDYNLVKGFVNLEMDNDFWGSKLSDVASNKSFGSKKKTGEKVLVEYSSPNTNKPLHLGHIRNILLGWSCAHILEANGAEVVKTQIVNDRGVAICKSMLSWEKFGNGETPESAGVKGDQLVGKYYVEFDKELKAEYGEWQGSPDAQVVYDERKKEKEEKEQFFKRYKNDYFNHYSELGKETRAMLLKWEDGDKHVKDLWNQMNSWVYSGFDDTYKSLGVDFDCMYYESNTYLLGKEKVEGGLDADIFYKEEDGSIWVDLEDVGMDKKILLRADGTSVYLTQDIGTSLIRYDDHKTEKMVYVVGDEQDYHFKVLFEVMKKLKAPFADNLYHLSYGMIDLPTGKMKSREGTVVDADDLIAEVIAEARKSAEEQGDISEMSKEEQDEVIRRVALGALKFFIIKVAPKKRMIFDPKESVDMQGQTGPYIQNAYVRIQGILRKLDGVAGDFEGYEILKIEKELVREILEYPKVINSAAKDLDPSLVANYCYNLAKAFHKYYHDVRILKSETEEAKHFRVSLIKVVSDTLQKGMRLLGIEMPERM